MTIKYICPHCRSQFAMLDHPFATEASLGFYSLTPEERTHIISYETNGDITARIACEYCSEALNRHPELAHPLQ
ncbi:DUF2757 family protein [Aneurinibacillus sp. Ricciae_BoGa-3]|uniref:anti-sigma-F factor Fin n=1 Tax=Aneurinibacillus sp. Ricciae_BoGa-3 TaxID=3022697 RepID=UPI0023414373|nr:anti-sigma-F factor Fin [Aneurinibacillus sp. Ricciae_BoGa-3]WCK54631.1 DUF2757 family protein [Aneurinibacillus sp. Ricciae_BoGa-3]